MTRRMCNDHPPKILKRIPIASLRAVRSTFKLKKRILLSFGRRQSRVGRMTRAREKNVGRRTKRLGICDLPGNLVGAKILKRIPIASLRAVRSTFKLKKRILLSFGRRQSRVGRRTKRLGIFDLPEELVGQSILTRVPITSLRAVRYTCNQWNELTKEWVLGKEAAAREQFLWFMTKDSKVCSVRFHKELRDLSIKQVELLNQFELHRVFHCDGLLLCIAKDKSRLVVCNPYLGQIKSIGFISDAHRADCYALGYDINRKHKILRFLDSVDLRVSRYEIYDISSSSWRVLSITSDCDIEHYLSGVSVKGNTYFLAQKRPVKSKDTPILLCFDFTTESFGPPLPLPFQSSFKDTVALSCVRDEELAVLYLNRSRSVRRCSTFEIWVTSTIDNSLSWNKFLSVKMEPYSLTGIWFSSTDAGSFFIDEEEKVAVVFDIDGRILTETETEIETETVRYHTAFIIGEDGYFKSVSLGVAPRVGRPEIYCPSLLCSSSYRPSLVELKPPKNKK